MSLETALLQRIVKEAFGTSASLLVCSLLQRGKQSLVELNEFCKLPWPLLRNSLLVLLKHGVVELRFERLPNAPEESLACSIKYEVNTDAILGRLRHARYLLFVESRWGVGARLLVLQMLKNGCCKMDDAIEGAIQDHAALEPILDPDCAATKGVNSEINRSKLTAVFKDLVVESVFARVFTLDDMLRATKTTPQFFVKKATITPARSRAPKEPTKAAGGLTGPPVRRRTNKRAGNSLASADVVGDLEMGENESELFEKMLDATKGGPSKKTKKSKTPNEPDTEDGTPSAEELKKQDEDTDISPSHPFRVHLEHLNMELYKQIVENFVTLRWGNIPIVRMVVRGLLTFVRRVGPNIISQAANFDQICHAVTACVAKENKKASAKREGDAKQLMNYDSKKLFAAIDGLARHTDKMVRPLKRDTGAAFQLDWDRIRDMLRRRVTCQCITTRLGPGAARVYALVLDADSVGQQSLRTRQGADTGTNDTSIYLRYGRFWNDQEVSDLALVSPQEARRYLCELAEAGYLKGHQADVVGAVPPSAASPLAKHCWVYGVKEEEAVSVCVRSMYQCIFNLIERKAVEVEKLQMIALQAHELSDQEVAMQTAREVAEDLLEASLSGVDQVLMVAREL